MLYAIIAVPAPRGFWTDTVGLLFTFGVLMPALVTGLVLVAMVSGRADKEADEEMRGRWARKRPPSSS